MGLGGARWCTEHNRNECRHRRKRGQGPCHASAIRGTDGCKIHVGMSTAAARVKGEAEVQAAKSVAHVTDPAAWSLSASPTIDYRLTVLSVLQMSAARMAFYSELLRRQVESEGLEAQPVGEDTSSADASGLIGFRYGAAGKDGIVYVQSEEVRALVALEASERDRVIQFSKVAHGMGISDRLTNLAERWSEVMASKLTLMFGELGLDAGQQALIPGLIAKHMTVVDLDAIGGSVTEAA